MPTVQLVVREQADGRRSLEAHPSIGQEPEDTWGENAEPLPIGSQALAEVAVSLREHGYRAMDLALVDYKFAPVPEDQARFLADGLLEQIRTGTREQVRVFLDSVMRGFYVENIVLRDEGPQNGRVTLVQDGLVRSTSDRQLGKVPDLLREALGFDTGPTWA